MYNLISRILDILCPMWNSKILDIDSDDASMMIDYIQDVITQLEE